MGKHQVFISYAGRDAFEASLLRYAIESMLRSEGVEAGTFQRDQARSEKEVARSLKDRVRECASIFLVRLTHCNLALPNGWSWRT